MIVRMIDLERNGLG